MCFLAINTTDLRSEAWIPTASRQGALWRACPKRVVKDKNKMWQNSGQLVYLFDILVYYRVRLDPRYFLLDCRPALPLRSPTFRVTRLARQSPSSSRLARRAQQATLSPWLTRRIKEGRSLLGYSSTAFLQASAYFPQTPGSSVLLDLWSPYNLISKP